MNKDIKKDKEEIVLSRLETVGCIVIISLIVIAGVVFGPGIMNTMDDNYKATHYQVKFITSDADLVEVYYAEQTSWFGTNIQLDYSPMGVNLTYVFDVSNRKEKYVYIEEYVFKDGLYNITTSPVYTFNYDSLIDNGGYANLTLVDTYVLIQVIPWE